MRLKRNVDVEPRQAPAETRSTRASRPNRGRTVDKKRLVLAAMIFSVAMLFIDQTIVALAVPNLQRDLHLSATGSQWIVNSYLLALSALFALGGKIADVYGPRRMVMAGVV